MAVDVGVRPHVAAEVHAYARNVVDGTIVAGKKVRQACQRHLDDLEHGSERGLRFSEDEANYALEFFSMLRLAEGEFADRPFDLQPSQVFIIGSLFGWLGPDGHRRFRTGYIEEAKGNGKTPLAGGIGLKGLVADGENAAQIFAAAVTREQAHLLFDDSAAMARRSLGAYLSVEKHTIDHMRSGSFYRPVSAEGRSLDGKRVHMALIDELHEHRTPVVVNKIRAGTKGRRQALIVEITNSGFDRTSICFEHHEYSRQVLDGTLLNDSWFAYIAQLDACEVHESLGRPEDDCPNCDDWRDESVWVKANPLLDVSITRKYLREQVAEAEGMPSKRNLTKRLNFCIWTEGSEHWLDVGKFLTADHVAGPAPLPEKVSTWLGLDLASVRDLTALFALAPRSSCGQHEAGGCFDIRCFFWAPEEGARDRSARDHVPYDVWAEQGWIRLTPGNVTDYARIRTDLRGLAERVTVRSIGYDRWNSTQLVTELGQDGFTLVPVGQGLASMNSPAKLLEGHVTAGLIHHDGNPVLAWMVSNAVVEMDAAGNIKPSKDKSSEKIDGISAWCDALFAWAGDDSVLEADTVWSRPNWSLVL